MKPVRKKSPGEGPSEFTCWKCDHTWKDVYVSGRTYLCPKCNSHKVTRRV